MQHVPHLLAVLALLAPAAPAAAARSPLRPPARSPAQSPARSAAEELAELQHRFEHSEGSYTERYEAFLPEYEAFARRHAGSEEGLSAKLWLLQQCWWLRGEGEKKMESRARTLADEILRDHPASKQLARVAEYDYVLAAADRARILGRLRESPHREVRATALYYLAKRARGGERRVLFKELAAKHGGLAYRTTTFGELADAALNPHRSEALAIGRVAPEIVGVDVEGEPLKLSDYRGKVVVLDFWGNW